MFEEKGAIEKPRNIYTRDVARRSRTEGSEKLYTRSHVRASQLNVGKGVAFGPSMYRN